MQMTAVGSQAATIMKRSELIGNPTRTMMLCAVFAALLTF
jgi:hypothetical protein